MIEPSERLLWCVVCVAALGTLGLSLPSVGAAAPVAATVLLLACVIDFVRAGPARAVSVTRQLASRVVVGQPSSVTVSLRAPRTMRVTVVQSLPQHALTVDQPADLSSQLTVPANVVIEVSWTPTFHKRGQFFLGGVTVRTRGPWGLVQRRRRHARTAADVNAFVVQPDVARLWSRAARLLRGSDVSARLRRRQAAEGTEVHSLRDYLRGDDPRRIAWKTSARRGVLTTKKLTPQQRQDVVIAIDCARQLAGAHAAVDGGQQRLDVAVNAALTLAAAALQRGDRVGMVPFADSPLGWVAARDGAAHLGVLSRCVFAVQASAVEADYAALAADVRRRQTRRAFVVIVTDLVDEPSARALIAAVTVLRAAHVVMIVALGDPGLVRIAAATDAMATAAKRILSHRARALSALRAVGALVVDASSATAAAHAVDGYVRVKGSSHF